MGTYDWDECVDFDIPLDKAHYQNVAPENDDAPTWVDATGKEWRLCDMGDDHLINAYRMIGRIESQYTTGYQPQGEMAVDAWESELGAVERQGDELAEEIRRRGLRQWYRRPNGVWERRPIFA